MGCAYMRLNQWEKALNAFMRVINIIPEVYLSYKISNNYILKESQAWTNIGNIYIQLKQ